MKNQAYLQELGKTFITQLLSSPRICFMYELWHVHVYMMCYIYENTHTYYIYVWFNLCTGISLKMGIYILKIVFKLSP